MKTIWIDIETTGLDPQADRIIELAAIYDDGNTEDIFHNYCKPFETHPENFNRIQELTGISWSKLEEWGVSDNQLYKLFYDWLSGRIDKFDKSDKTILSGYNISFDDAFMRQLFYRNGDNYYGSFFFNCRLDIFSSVALALRQGKIPVLPDYKNKTLATHFKIKLSAHNALEDIKASRQVQIEIEKLLLKN